MKFEYKKEYFAIQYEMAGVNEMGESGWELCSINDGAFYFKRAVEVKNLAQPDVIRQSELLVDFSDKVIWKDHRVHIHTKVIEDYLKSTNSL